MLKIDKVKNEYIYRNITKVMMNIKTHICYHKKKIIHQKMFN